MLIRDCSKDSTNDFRVAGENNNAILSLKCRSEAEKKQFEDEIKRLQERLKAKQAFQEMDDTAFNAAAAGMEEYGDDFANPIEILRLKVNRVVSINKEKKRLLEQYVRNAQVIEQAFDQIKDNSGITDIDEIVTTFIKAEEQNYSLFNYVNVLNSETDSLEENIRDLDAVINQYKIQQE
jgi:coiled-coil domain-containing protein 63/114